MRVENEVEMIRKQRILSEEPRSTADIDRELKLHFSQRQINWIHQLYINDVEERLLARVANAQVDNRDDLITAIKAIHNNAFHCGWDCSRYWFEDCISIKLIKLTKKYNFTDDQVHNLLIDICEFDQEQVDEMKNDDFLNIEFSSHFPYWMSASESAVSGWEEGLKRGREDIERQFKQPIKKFLAEILSQDELEKEIKDIFYMKYFDEKGEN